MANIQDIRAINTPQKSYMWEVEIRALASGVIDSMSSYAKTVSIPQSAVEQIIINHKAGRAHHAGRDAAAHTVTITFWDDEAKTIYTFFNNWMELIHNPLNAGGLPRDLYSAEMVIKLKDSTDAVVTAEYKMGHVFPIDIAEVPLSYDASEPVEITITMSYDEKQLIS